MSTDMMMNRKLTSPDLIEQPILVGTTPLALTPLIDQK